MDSEIYQHTISSDIKVYVTVRFFIHEGYSMLIVQVTRM